MFSRKAYTLVLATLATGLLLLAGCGGQGTGATKVEGKLVDTCGQPISYKTIYVPGHDPVMTDAEGEFVIPDVQTPYDLVVANAYLAPGVRDRADVSILVYKGLTTSEPLIWAKDLDKKPNDSCVSASASVALKSSKTGTDYENGAALLLPPYMNGTTFAADSSATISLKFDPDLAGEAPLFGIQWKKDPDTGDATAFVGAKSISVSLDDGSSIQKELELDEAGMGSRSMVVSVEAPAVMRVDGIGNYVSVDGTTLKIQTAQLDSSEAGEDGTYSIVVPEADGVGSTVFSSAEYGDARAIKEASALDISTTMGFVGVWQAVPATGHEMTVSFPEPLVPVAPLNGATIDPASTTFSWSGHEGDVYEAIFDLHTTGPEVVVEVVTTEPQLQLPDLGGLGLTFDSLDQGEWFVIDFGGALSPGSVDDFTSREGFSLLAPIYMEEDGPFSAQADAYFMEVFGGEFTGPAGNAY